MNVLELFSPIRNFLFAPEVITGDTAFYNSDTIRYSLNSKDVYALNIAVDAGYNIMVISVNAGGMLKELLRTLNIQIVSDINNAGLREMRASHQADLSTTLYMGYDLPDLRGMAACALPCCPNDAVPEIKAVSNYISPQNAGAGAARDVLEKVLKLNGKW